jgi:ribose-phosphate pyrophosphokinase
MQKITAAFLMIWVFGISVLHAADYGSELSFCREAIIFSGNANYGLAEEVANYLGVPLGEVDLGRFNDGEIRVSINTNIRNRDVFIIQSNCPSEHQSINDNIMELFLMVRTLKRASAASITAVIPYYGYARQDRKTAGRVPISAADIAMMLEQAGVDRVVTIDLHCGQIQGFFHNIPVDNLYALPLFTSYFLNKGLRNIVIVSPDAGGVERAKKFMEDLRRYDVCSEMALISKQRVQAGMVASMRLIGDVEDADAIIIDDICDTGGTLVKAAELLKANGARHVFAAITHPVFSNTAVELIRDSMIDEMVVANTIPLRGEVPPNIQTISVGALLGEAIYRIQSGESLSALFNGAFNVQSHRFVEVY